MEMGRLWQILVVCFVFLAQSLVIKCCVREEREALLNIKAYFIANYNDTPVEYYLWSWITDPESDCCTWKMVKCHPSSGRVSMLSFNDFQSLSFGDGNGHYIPLDFSLFKNFKELTNLSSSYGPFQSLENTSVLGNLSKLEVLILRSNYLEGSLPLQELCKLKRIRVLDFSHNHFNGSLHKCLANLTSLQALDLSSNELTGQIPVSAIAALTSLEYFSAMHNNFKGIFPLGSLTNNSRLKVLSLQMNNNEFQVDTESEALPLFQLDVLNLANCKVKSPSATIPSFLLYQHDLQFLDLSNNDLGGMFPSWLLLNNTKLKSLLLSHNRFKGTFQFLSHTGVLPLINLQLSYNEMEGELPGNMDLMLPNLKWLNVSGNELYGVIPPSIGNMSNLIALDLSKNIFSGQVPKSLWAGCDSLQVLILSHNNLAGTLFPSHFNSSSIYYLFMDNNYLNGTLDHGIWKLSSLLIFDISNNCFSGILPTIIDHPLFPLEEINLSRNNFTGTLPIEFCKLRLLQLQLSHNSLSGSIPSCYFEMTLISLRLQHNRLVGSIPSSIKRSENYPLMEILDLKDNKLSGVIPHWIVEMMDLHVLLLGGNQLHGQLPNQLCNLKSLSLLDLSRNNFTGNIPACLHNASSDNWNYNEILTFYGSIDDDYYYKPLHLQLSLEVTGYYDAQVVYEADFTTKNVPLGYQGLILGLMFGIDLSSNQLTGTIPLELGYMKSLRALNLSRNYLNGSIPKSFHNLSNIESIDLSHNNLSGEIPSLLQDLSSLSVFNVSYNNLYGTVPNGGQFSTFDDSCFEGNQHLKRNNNNKGNSTRVPPLPSPFNNDTKEDESIIDFSSFIWSFLGCYVAVLVTMTTVLWINPYWRRLWFYFIENCLYRCFYPYLKDAFW